MDKNVDNALLEAVKTTNVEAAQKAINDGANVNVKCTAQKYEIGPNESGITFLTLDGARENGGTINYYTLKTALLLVAADSGNLDLINLLIRSGANLNASEVKIDNKTGEALTEESLEEKLDLHGLKLKKAIFSRNVQAVENKNKVQPTITKILTEDQCQ